ARSKSNGEVGHELDKVETGVTEPVPVKKEPAVSLEEATKAVGSAVPAEESRGTRDAAPAITNLNIKGDAEVLDKAELRTNLEADTIGKSLTDDQIRAVAQKYQDALIKKGYYIARVWAPTPPVTDGVLTL